MKSFVNWNEKKKRKIKASSHDNKDFEFDDVMAQLTKKQNQIFDMLSRQEKIKKMKRPFKWIKEKKTYTIKKRLNNDEPETIKTFEWETITDNPHTDYWQHPKWSRQNIQKPFNLRLIVKYLWITAFILLLLVFVLLAVSAFK